MIKTHFHANFDFPWWKIVKLTIVKILTHISQLIVQEDFYIVCQVLVLQWNWELKNHFFQWIGKIIFSTRSFTSSFTNPCRLVNIKRKQYPNKLWSKIFIAASANVTRISNGNTAEHLPWKLPNTLKLFLVWFNHPVDTCYF